MSSIAKKLPKRLEFVIVGVVGEERKILVKTIEDLNHHYLECKFVVLKNLYLSTNYLITTSENTSQTKQKAQHMKNVQIITPDQFRKLFISNKNSKKRLTVMKEDLIESKEDSDKQVEKPKKKQKNTESEETLNEITQQAMMELSEIISYLNSDLQLSIPFVNRKAESIELAKALLDQKRNDLKGPLPVLSQLFGSGKSSLVRNFRNILEQENILSGDTYCDMLMKATLINVTLGRLHLSVRETIEYLFKLIRTTIMVEIAKNNRIDDKLKKKSIMFANFIPTEEARQDFFDLAKYSLPFFLAEWSNHDLAPLIIFFDESELTDTELQEFWSFFYSFLGAAHPRCDNVFFVIAGRSSNLSVLSRVLISTHMNLETCHIVLNMMEIQHIQELIEKTTISSKAITMKTLLKKCCGVADVEYFARVLYKYSGGIPGLIIAVFEAIIQHIADGHPLELSDSDSMSKLFKDLKDC